MINKKGLKIEKEITDQSKLEYNNVINFLNNFIIGARMSDDFENELRAYRALSAFEADPEINIFSEEYITKEAKEIFGNRKGESKYGK